MARGSGDKASQDNPTVDQEQQAQQNRQRSVGSKMIHLPVALFKAMMHHGQKQLDPNNEEAAAEQIDDPQAQPQQIPNVTPMPMTQAAMPMPVQGLAPVRTAMPGPQQ